MKRFTCLNIGFYVILLFVCLFGERLSLQNGSFVGGFLREAGAILQDPGSQWMAMVCACMYLIVFSVIKLRISKERILDWRNAIVWNMGALLIGIFVYASNYTTASKTNHAFVLVAGAALGQGFSVMWLNQKGGDKTKLAVVFLIILELFLLIGALWPERAPVFLYHNQVRRHGPWDSPNLYGLLMGVGFTVAVWTFVLALKPVLFQKDTGGRPERTPCDCDDVDEVSRNNTRCVLEKRKTLSKSVIWTCVLFQASVAICCGVGLIKSYSRGAWLGVALAHGVLAFQKFKSFTAFRFSLNQHWRICLCLMALSLGTICFWQFRDANNLIVRRFLSVGNINDFSWRNRLVAWKGAFEMMGDKPWFGFGWNESEHTYNQYYRPMDVDEGLALGRNDFLMLGTTIGVPAVICFFLYIWHSLQPVLKLKATGRGTLEFRGNIARTRDWVLSGSWAEKICLAAVMVLLTGSWLDGILLNPATGVPFWILLELGVTMKAAKWS